MASTRRELLGTLGGLGAVSLAGCAGRGGAGSQETTTETMTTEESTTTQTTTQTPTETTTTALASEPTVQVRSHPDLGDILVDGDGMTLYMFDSDTKGDGASTCYGGCADNWPPLVGDSPAAGSGVSASLSTFERDNGDAQVAANGWPLYYFTPDSAPGDVQGQGVGDVWWVLNPAGEPVRDGSTTTTETTDDGMTY